MDTSLLRWFFILLINSPLCIIPVACSEWKKLVDTNNSISFQLGNNNLNGKIRSSGENPNKITGTPGALIYLVKNANLSAWLRAQGPDAFLTKRGPILLLHRGKRQVGNSGGGSGGGGGGSGGGSSGVTNANPPKVVTPVLPINGDKKFNDTDCMPWEDVAVIMRSSLHPKHKAAYIDPKSCNVKQGLECLEFEERGVALHRCQCMLVYGHKAVYSNYTDNTGRIQYSCFIPAGLGWESECHEKNWDKYGYPLPFGDPSGTNAEPAAQTDAINKPSGEQVVVDYIRWNSVEPKCVPHAICREKGTYRGQRCQCKMGHRLEKPEGKCSGASTITTGLTIASIIIALQFT